MKTVYNSNELEIVKQGNEFGVIDKISDHLFEFDCSFDYFYDDHKSEINTWDFCKQYPDVMPILVDLGELEKWRNGFKIGRSSCIACYDMQMIHRIIKYNNGDTFYQKYGKIHRHDGPAVEFTNGSKEWWINGKHIANEDVNQWMSENNYTVVPFNKSTQAKFILTFA